MVYKTFWKWLKDNSSQLQTLVALLGVLTVVGGVYTVFNAAKALDVELQKLNLDYGSQAELTMSGSSFLVRTQSSYVTNVKVETIPYLQLSDKQFVSSNSQFIKLKNYFECFDDFYAGYNDCEGSEPSRPRWPKMFYQLEIIFNQAPTKVYPSILCVSKLEFTNPKGVYEKTLYITENCDPDEYGLDPNNYRVNEDQLGQILPKDKIIGEIDYKSAGMLGFGNPSISRQVLNLLSHNRWHSRYIENAQTRWWRLDYRFGKDSLRELKQMRSWDREYVREKYFLDVR